jgi:hypothetical protein
MTDDMKPVGTFTVAELADHIDSRPDVPVAMVLWIQVVDGEEIVCRHVGAHPDRRTDDHRQLLAEAYELIDEWDDEDETEKDPQP